MALVTTLRPRILWQIFLYWHDMDIYMSMWYVLVGMSWQSNLTVPTPNGLASCPILSHPAPRGVKSVLDTLPSNPPGQLLRRTEILSDFGPQQSFPEMCGFRSLLGQFAANGHIACETTWFPVGFPLSKMLPRQYTFGWFMPCPS